jgi:zinc and cadmium transporter
MILVDIIISGFVMALISLSGALALAFSEKVFNKLLLPMVAFSAGALIGGAFFHLIPESAEKFGSNPIQYVWIVVGFIIFYILEEYIHWHHCHKAPSRHINPVSYLILIAKSVHNIIDGAALAASFVASPALGWATLLAISSHEVPQELGDFGILVHSGWTKSRALLFNLLSSLTFLIGAVGVYFLARTIQTDFLLPFAAGSFIYIASADLIPEINKREVMSTKLTHFGAFLAGIILLFAVKLLVGH